jgi:alpha-glucosidase
MKELIREAGKRGMRIMLDLVVNHVSDQHPWFQDVLKNPNSEFNGCFVIRQPGERISNHISIFGGTAWWELKDGRRYYRTFDKTQVDLNYDDPRVLEMIEKVMRYWFELGIGGFRIDAVHLAGKTVQDCLTDAEPNKEWTGHPKSRFALHHEAMTEFRPGTFKILRRLGEIAGDYDGAVIFEAAPPDPADADGYRRMYDEVDIRYAAPIYFGLLFIDWQAQKVKGILERMLDKVPPGATFLPHLENHDRTRFTSRVGSAQAFVGMALVLGMPGNPLIYYGGEIGMRNARHPRIADDPSQAPGDFVRDRARTPMQWDDSPHAGFTTAVKAWIKVCGDYHLRNVKRQEANPRSMLQFTRALTRFRNSLPELQEGEFEWLESGNADVISFRWRLGDQQVVYALNFTPVKQEAKLPRGLTTILLSSRRPPNSWNGDESVTLRPDEALVLR